MFDKEILEDEVLDEELLLVYEPKLTTIKNWLIEKKKRFFSRKSDSQELYKQGIYNKLEEESAFKLRKIFGIAKFVAAGCFVASIVSFFSVPVLASIGLIISAISLYKFDDLHMKNITKYEKISNLKEEIEELEVEEKNEKKSGLLESIKNIILRNKINDNYSEVDNFEEIEDNIDDIKKKPSIFKKIKNIFKDSYSEIDNFEEMVETEEVIETKEQKTNKKEKFIFSKILNVKLSRTFNKVRIKESTVNFVPGIGIYIYPVAKENKEQQKFFEAGYKAVYQTKPNSIETESHKVYIMKQF